MAKKGKEGSEEESLKELEIKLEEKTNEAEEYLTRLKYLQADFDNFKKRVEKDKGEFVKYATGILIMKLIDVNENLERAVKSATGTEKDDMVKGIEMIHKQLDDILKNEGLEPITALGETFDTFKHEVMMCEDKGGVEEDCILEEFQRGYMLHDKVLRHSKVKVCKR